jgi:hypothetical protein
MTGGQGRLSLFVTCAISAIASELQLRLARETIHVPNESAAWPHVSGNA